MKKDIHPKSQEVVFKDSSSDEMFLTSSTIKTNKTVTYEGKKYPLVEVEITSSSHPFYTGTQKLVDTAGRIDRFKKRFKLDTK